MHGADPGPLSESGGEQRPIPFVLMRGGTSKAVFLRGADLPPPGDERDRLILALFGSPDPRQVDGLGGADLLTSKLAIIDPPTRPDADLDYTFGQVSITEPVIDYDINCGNISAAVAAFAVDEGLVPAVDPVTSVRIHNTNTARILTADVPIRGGVALVEGEQRVDGVPGTGAPIWLDYSRTAGGATGALLPTGNVTDTIEIGLGAVEVTVIDLANLTVFVDAAAVGMTGTEAPGQLSEDQRARVEEVKGAAAALAGVDPDGLVPVPVVVSGPAPYVSYADGSEVDADDVDLVARVIGGRPSVLHKAYPGTVSACTGVAAWLPGTVPYRVAARRFPGRIAIGHPSGVMTVLARADSPPHSAVTVTQAAYARTARRLAEGTAFVRVRALVP